MNAKTRANLIEIGRAFYEGTADAFSDSRRDPWPGWTRAMSHVKPGPGVPFRILDVGCGNGRFASYLEREGPIRRAAGIDYVGIDSSPSLLEHARNARIGLERLEFVECDVLDLESAPLHRASFDLIVAFGILHHIPGAETRRAFVRSLISMLNSSGVLIVTAWQFANSKRLLSRTLSWSQYNENATVPIEVDDLDAGDSLLQFGDSPHPRYCHHTSKDELHTLLSDSTIEWLDEYTADGKTDDLNLYAVVTRRPPTAR